jgi:outer membrane receptor for ferrienterochelin and colicin
MNLAAGADFRSYRGSHFQTIYDLLGGDYYVNMDDLNSYDIYNPQSVVKKEGDTISYNYDGLVNWAGGFGQLEYKAGNWSSFINVSGAYSFYKRIDYFKKMDIVLEDTILSEALAYNDTVEYNGNSYSIYSPEARYSQTAWKGIPSFTIKGGINYNLNEYNNVFVNLGFISKAPMFRNVIDYDNKFFRDIKNEQIKAFELGYSFNHKKVIVNVNGYYTFWTNKPLDGGLSVSIDGETYSANVNGMEAIHKGVELEFSYKILKNLEWEGIVSIGDWRWNSTSTAYIYDDQLNLIDSVAFDAKGVHVGDAAQTQVGTNLRYEIIKGLYVKAQFTYFGRYYADFNPFSLTDGNEGRESWIIPTYYTIDAFAGYKFKFAGCLWDLKLNVLNVLDQMYISDAFNNDTYVQSYNDFDAKSASVFFGMGRRFTTSLSITF